MPILQQLRVTLYEDGSVSTDSKEPLTPNQAKMLSAHFMYLAGTCADQGWDVAIDQILREAARARRVGKPE